MKILLIEDEKSLQEVIADYLNTEGYVVALAADFKTAIEKIDVYDYDCLLVDITLPDGNGLDIIRHIKQHKPETGIIILSAKDSIDDKIKGLELGSDDYLPKPFHLAELNARIRSLRRRRQFSGKNEVIFNEIKVLPDSFQVFVQEKEIVLTKKEFDLLLFFIANKKNLKEFTDNASHELQTPLTVMQSKLENLFQDDTLTDKQSLVLSDLYQQTTRLSRLSQTLLLLSKIENQQYSNTQFLDFKTVIEQKLNQFEDLISDKNIIVQTKFSEIPPLSINPVLADILLSNLIGNAIRHNKEGGQINILLENQAFSIKNTGKKDLVLDKTKIFQRFFKDNAESHSFGLGLALVQQIADNQKWQTSYDFENGLHVFSISFQFISIV